MSKHFVMWAMTLAVLVPSLYGFGTKFSEFVALYRGDVEGAFAISPILNYLLASVGFLCLFGWAALHGMFRDIERPKFTMLENEALLDRAATWQGQLRPEYLIDRKGPEARTGVSHSHLRSQTGHEWD